MRPTLRSCGLMLVTFVWTLGAQPPGEKQVRERREFDLGAVMDLRFIVPKSQLKAPALEKLARQFAEEFNSRYRLWQVVLASNEGALVHAMVHLTPPDGDWTHWSRNRDEERMPSPVARILGREGNVSFSLRDQTGLSRTRVMGMEDAERIHLGGGEFEILHLFVSKGGASARFHDVELFLRVSQPANTLRVAQDFKRLVEDWGVLNAFLSAKPGVYFLEDGHYPRVPPFVHAMPPLPSVPDERVWKLSCSYFFGHEEPQPRCVSGGQWSAPD